MKHFKEIIAEIVWFTVPYLFYIRLNAFVIFLVAYGKIK
jgi:hypothetical protein